MEPKSCETCKHWGGVSWDDVANCKLPLPECVLDRLAWEDEDESVVRQIAGDCGTDCACWEAGK